MKRILIIDDDEQVRVMLRKTVERAGYEALEAPDGQRGMEINNSTPADLIITDIFMPEKEGLETIMALKETLPDTKIIAISGGGGYLTNSIRYLEMAKQLGAAQTFPKPVDRKKLLETIQELLT